MWVCKKWCGWLAFFAGKSQPSAPFLIGSEVLSCGFRFWAGQEEEIERRYLQIARHIRETSTANVERGRNILHGCGCSSLAGKDNIDGYNGPRTHNS
jgi:predicted small metal-binding protein